MACRRTGRIDPDQSSLAAAGGGGSLLPGLSQTGFTHFQPGERQASQASPAALLRAGYGLRRLIDDNFVDPQLRP